MPDFPSLTTALNTATRAGDLSDAYRVFQGLSADDARVVALKTGFSIISGRSEKAFFQHLLSQVAAAVRNRTDGFGLRKKD